jgi:hypothetical protein
MARLTSKVTPRLSYRSLRPSWWLIGILLQCISACNICFYPMSTSLIHFGKYKPDAFRSDALRCPSAKNVDPKIVQDTLDHASLSMTLGVYSHVQAAMKDEAAAAMDSTFS